MQMRINIPPLTRVLLALLIAISVTHQITRYVFGGLDQGFLAIVPQWSLFYPWVYATATFAEQNVVTLLIAGATILYGGKYLERAWSSTEFAKFVLIVTVLPNVAATIIYVLWFALTRDESRAYVDSVPHLPNVEADPPFLQAGLHPRLCGSPGRLPRCVQAARPRTHGDNTEGHYQDTSEALSRHFPSSEHDLRVCVGHRYSTRVGLGGVLYQLDIPSIL